MSTLFWLIIALHVVAAVLPIRQWPLSDYPMFSGPIAPFSEISRLSVETVYEDRVVPWSHEDYGAIGLNDHRLQAHVNDVFNPRVEEILGAKVNRRPDWQTAHGFRIVRRTFAYRDGHVVESREIVREIDVAKLKL